MGKDVSIEFCLATELMYTGSKRRKPTVGTYVATQTISTRFREAHMQALEPGGKLPQEIAAQVDAHLQYMKELKAKGKVLAGGPTVAFTWGLSLIVADSLEEAKTIAENDPGVRAGILADVRVEPWYHMV